MGKWYSGIGRERFGHTNSFAQMDAPHAKVHDSVFKNVEYIKEHSTLKYDHPKRIVENFRAMEDASYELYIKLDGMLEEYNNKR